MNKTLTKAFLLSFFCAYQFGLAQNSSYSIRNTDLQIEPDFSTKVVSISARIEIQNPGRESEFTFGLNDRYDSVVVTSVSSPVSTHRADGEITITMKNPPEDFELTFRLKGMLGKSVDENCEIVTDSSLFLLWSDRFYPIDFGRWSPTKIRLVLPSGFQAIAPGRITQREKLGSQVVYTFETSQPIVSASVFADTRWIATEHVVDGILMKALLYPESQVFCDQIFRTSAEVLKFFSALLCPYPFDEFAFVTIRGMYARRAFPGFVGYGPRYLQKEFTTTGHDAHETSLLWWTYTLHGTGPGSFQWTEGFGDYVEILYDEDFHKPIPAIFERFRREYLATPDNQDLPYDSLRGNTPQKLVHGKYPWLMHLVRGVVGDSAFRNALTLVFQRFRHRTFSMNEFISTMEEGSGQSLRWWREEWLERKGVPIIAFGSHTEKNNAGFVITCSFEQRGPLYRLPLEIGLVSSIGIEMKKVYLNQKRATVTYESEQEPIRIVLDPKGWVPMHLVPIE